MVKFASVGGGMEQEEVTVVELVSEGREIGQEGIKIVVDSLSS